jgi:hypothetical protein
MILARSVTETCCNAVTIRPPISQTSRVLTALSGFLRALLWLKARASPTG